jgi:hypothetical protein
MDFEAADVTRIAAEAASIEQTRRARPAKVQQDPAPAPVAPSQGQRVEVSFQDNTPVYRFVDARSGDLVLQVPPEEVLRVVRSIQQMLQTTQGASLDLKL